jgi:hypothetical protein
MRPLANRLPYDSTEMLLAFHVSEKARAKRDRYIMQFPEESRGTGKKEVYPGTGGKGSAR